MSLSDKAREARAHADGCTNPSCHAVAAALEGALHAAAREQLAGLEPEQADPSGIPDPREAGYPSNIRIERSGTEN
jgi:hypothetical protein